MKLQIIYFTTGEWDSCHRKERLKTLASKGTNDIEIICLNRPIDFFVSLIKNISKLLNWIFGKDRIEKICNNIYIYTPLVLIHGSKELICWISNPEQSHFINLFPKSIVVYDVIDNARRLIKS